MVHLLHDRFFRLIPGYGDWLFLIAASLESAKLRYPRGLAALRHTQLRGERGER